MQPGPPYPPQQPGQPFQPQQPGPPDQPQQPYQQPYPPQQYQGYPQPPAPRKARTGLIVLIVVIAVVLVGGGTTAVILLTGKGSSDASTAGRYTSQPGCDKINTSSWTFETTGSTNRNGEFYEICTGDPRGGSDDSQLVRVTMTTFVGSDGIAKAKKDSANDEGKPESNTGFENPPLVAYAANGIDGNDCTIDYVRSNRHVKIDFSQVPDINDLDHCINLGIPDAHKLYEIIG